MNKKLLFTLIFIVVATLSVNAQQKYGYIYSEKVFKSLPEYNSAVTQLEQYANSAKDRSEEMLKNVKNMYSQYVKYRDNMTSSQRKQQEQMLIEKERDANKYESDFFGKDGAMSKKQKELMEPIEKAVSNAVTALATEKGYDMIFDLSLSKSTIYQSPKLDLTQQVIDKLK